MGDNGNSDRTKSNGQHVGSYSLEDGHPSLFNAPDPQSCAAKFDHMAATYSASRFTGACMPEPKAGEVVSGIASVTQCEPAPNSPSALNRALGKIDDVLGTHFLPGRCVEISQPLTIDLSAPDTDHLIAGAEKTRKFNPKPLPNP